MIAQRMSNGKYRVLYAANQAPFIGSTKDIANETYILEGLGKVFALNDSDSYSRWVISPDVDYVCYGYYVKNDKPTEVETKPKMTASDWQQVLTEDVYDAESITFEGVTIRRYGKNAPALIGSYDEVKKFFSIIDRSEYERDIKRLTIPKDAISLVAERLGVKPQKQQQAQLQVVAPKLPVVYDKSAIMKRSWELRRMGMTASNAMKQAWAEYKNGGAF